MKKVIKKEIKEGKFPSSLGKGTRDAGGERFRYLFRPSLHTWGGGTETRFYIKFVHLLSDWDGDENAFSVTFIHFFTYSY